MSEPATAAPDLLVLLGVDGDMSKREPCEMCGERLVLLTMRNDDGSTRSDYFEVVKDGGDVLHSLFILHSDRHTGRRSVHTR